MVADHGAPRIWEAFSWGLLSAVSLNIGSLVGVTCLPRKKVRAVLMSFGGGSLLFALSIELFGHVLAASQEEGDTGPVWAMEASAVLGGVLFAALNRTLNRCGADVRKPATTRGRFRRLRGVLMRRLALRLWKIPFFSELTLQEVKELMQSAMSRERYRKGDIIISQERGDGGIFFILSGLVRLSISELEGGCSPCCEEGKTWELGPDKVFGDMAVLAGNDVSSTAVALESTKVLVLPCHEVVHLIETNDRVREHVARSAVERLRQLEAFQGMVSVQRVLDCSCLQTFQPGDVVFEGTVQATTPIMLLVSGEVEVSPQRERCAKTVVRGTGLLCAEHFLKVPCEAFTATSTEVTSVLVVQRHGLEEAHAEGRKRPEPLDTPCSSVTMLPEPALLPGQAEEVLFAPGHAWRTPSSGGHAALAHIGRELGWEAEDTVEGLPDRRQLLRAKTAMEDIMGVVTDQDLEERELRLEVQHRTASKNSEEPEGTSTEPPPAAEGFRAHGAIMVWLGILIDAVPESLVIGIIVNKARGSTTQAALPFVIGVFLSNLPESMSSSGSMKAHGIQVRRILLMWWTITFLTALGAAAGAVLFPPGSSEDPAAEIAVSAVEGLAAGAMLTMIAQTMLPEAFEQGGDIVGLSCLAGFLCALSVKLIPFGDHHQHAGH